MHWDIRVAWKIFRMLRWEKCNPPEAFLPAEKGAKNKTKKGERSERGWLSWIDLRGATHSRFPGGLHCYDLDTRACAVFAFLSFGHCLFFVFFLHERFREVSMRPHKNKKNTREKIYFFSWENSVHGIPPGGVCKTPTPPKTPLFGPRGGSQGGGKIDFEKVPWSSAHRNFSVFAPFLGVKNGGVGGVYNIYSSCIFLHKRVEVRVSTCTVCVCVCGAAEKTYAKRK